MKAALAQAKKAYALDEVPIGCVIVYEGKIIGRGYNRRNTDKNTLSHAEITAIRRMLTPVVERVCRMWLRMHGYPCGCEVVWDDINLQDQVEESRAELYREQARRLRIENDRAEQEKQGGV